MKKTLIFIALVFSCADAADYPSGFSNAKAKAEKKVYYDRNTTFYCACEFVFDDTQDLDGDGNTHETMIKPQSCGYQPRNPVTNSGKPNARTSRIEWEHVMPAHLVGGHLDEWQNREKYPSCMKSNGKFLSGRDCAYKLNSDFKRAHDDMNNLVPAVGELNGDRSNYAFGELIGEDRVYGQCDFEVDFSKKLAEPADSVKGNIARTYFYMIKEHGAQVTHKKMTMLLYWAKLDPVDEWECERNNRIQAEQGISNSFVTSACK